MNYKILEKNKKFYFTPNNTIYSALMISCFLFLIQLKIFGEENLNWFGLLMIGIMFLCLILAVFFSTYNLFRYESLQGELSGNLEFKQNEIIVNNHNYLLEEISHIRLNTYDFKGRLISYRGNLNGTKSNGTNNNIEIEFYNDKTIKFKFQQLYENQIFEDEQTLINYCNKGKLNYLTLLDILKITDYKKIQEFKKRNLKRFQ